QRLRHLQAVRPAAGGRSLPHHQEGASLALQQVQCGPRLLQRRPGLVPRRGGVSGGGGRLAYTLSSIAASLFGVTIARGSAGWKHANEETPLQDLAAYWGMAAIILVPIGLALIAWLLPGKD